MTQQWNSLGHDVRSGGSTNLKNLFFTLYLMEAATGFSDNAQGTTKYIDTCKQNGLLPVGCGTTSYDCDKNRYYGEPCLPMPASWNCNMMSYLRDNLGWGNNIVALQADNRHGYLYKPNGNPSGGENLRPVCGKITGGIFYIGFHYWLRVLCTLKIFTSYH